MRRSIQGSIPGTKLVGLPRLAVEHLLLWQVAIKKPVADGVRWKWRAHQSAAFDLLKGTERSPTKRDFNETCNCFPTSGLFKSI